MGKLTKLTMRRGFAPAAAGRTTGKGEIERFERAASREIPERLARLILHVTAWGL